jgi:hypothetical protein
MFYCSAVPRNSYIHSVGDFFFLAAVVSTMWLARKPLGTQAPSVPQEDIALNLVNPLTGNGLLRTWSYKCLQAGFFFFFFFLFIDPGFYSDCLGEKNLFLTIYTMVGAAHGFCHCGLQFGVVSSPVESVVERMILDPNT